MLHSAQETRKALAHRDMLLRTSAAGDQSESHTGPTSIERQLTDTDDDTLQQSPPTWEGPRVSFNDEHWH